MSLTQLLGVEEEEDYAPAFIGADNDFAFEGEDHDPSSEEEEDKFTLSEKENASPEELDGVGESRKKGPFERHHTRYANLPIGVMTEHHQASVHAYIREDLKRSQRVPFDVFVKTVFGLTPKRAEEWTSIIAKEQWHEDEELATRLRQFAEARKEDKRYWPLCAIINLIIQMAHGRLPGVPNAYPIDDICVERNDPFYIIPSAAHGKLAANRRPDLLTLRHRHAAKLRSARFSNSDTESSDESPGTTRTSATTVLGAFPSSPPTDGLTPTAAPPTANSQPDSSLDLASLSTVAGPSPPPPRDRRLRRTRAGKTRPTANTRVSATNATAVVGSGQTANEAGTTVDNTRAEDDLSACSSHTPVQASITTGVSSSAEKPSESHEGTPTPDKAGRRALAQCYHELGAEGR
ncbi:hypothetical protein NM688_g1195 [Phlebia brevispora]|uniref:Uncharacterized protein n=1 Tax=Phlebia brevispora TaxID=194682 RepID=A0ACC1TC63_9APHY|nr:hypothetical protein NM688_g1195 [Phlebia brevispora]